MKRALVVSAFALGMLVACGKDKGSQHPLLGDWKLPARAGAAAAPLVPAGVTLNETLRVENDKVTMIATCSVGAGPALRSTQITASAPAKLEKDKLLITNSARVTTAAGVVPPCTADLVGGPHPFTVSGTQLTLTSPALPGAPAVTRTAVRAK